MGTGFVVLCIMASLVWLGCMLAFLIAWRWRANSSRFVPAVIAIAVGLSLTYLGLTRFHVSYSQTVNGRTTFKLDSRWLFTISAIAGVVVIGSFALNAKRRNLKPA